MNCTYPELVAIKQQEKREIDFANIDYLVITVSNNTRTEYTMLGKCIVLNYQYFVMCKNYDWLNAIKCIYVDEWCLVKSEVIAQLLLVKAEVRFVGDSK